MEPAAPIAAVKQVFTWKWLIAAAVLAIVTVFIVQACFRQEVYVTDDQGNSKKFGEIKNNFKLFNSAKKAA